jgi:lysozyme
MNDAMRASRTLYDFLRGRELFRSRVYQDLGKGHGTWTIGYGHTAGVTAHSGPISLAQAEALLHTDVAIYEAAVRKTKRPLNQQQYDALVSFTFNVGVEGFLTSTLLEVLNGGDYAGAAAQMLRWVQSGGKVVAELSRRRAVEKAWFEGHAPVLA